MRVVPSLVMILLLTGPVLAEAPASKTTELVDGRCRFVDDDGEVGDYALKRCPGLAGARVYTEATPAKVALSFRWGNAKSGDVVASHSVGDKLEWRGTMDKRHFVPYATIVRIVVRDDDSMDDEGRFKTHNVLGVIRMEKRAACLMSVIDEAANPDASRLARATADAEAQGFACAGGKPKIVGKTSRWAQKAIGESQSPKPAPK